MRPLKRETVNAQVETVQPTKIPHQISGSALAGDLAAANDQSAPTRKGLLARRRKRQARRSFH
ncbi:MAG: hypothetical protein AAFS13_03775 [Pseudomonadota bacterium]